MNNLISKGIIAAFLICMVSATAAAKSAVPDPYASSSPTKAAERVEHYIEVFSEAEGKGREIEVYEPGASFIKLHFSQFRLPKGLEIEISNPSGTESYRYSNNRRDALTYNSKLGDDGVSSFSAMSMMGDTVIIRVHGNGGKKLAAGGKASAFKHRVLIDSMLVGLPETEAIRAGTGQSQAQSIEQTGNATTEEACGSVDYEPVFCYQPDDSNIFDRARPVAKVITGTGQVCTAWRVGSGNRMMASKECVADGAAISSLELWFNYQSGHCFFTEPLPVTKVTGNSLLASSDALDYILFTVNDFSSISGFGYMGLDVREASLNEQIYITHHSESGYKLVSVQSDMNVGGVCKVDSVNDGGNTEIGYFCDTWYGGSGAPVMAASSDRVIAMNHNPLDGCYNTGVKMTRIWPEISSHFGGVIPAGDLEDSNQAPEADLGWSCSQMQCNFNASGSSDPDGFIVGYQWDTGDGFATSNVSFTHEYSVPGPYTITLTVEDNDGGTATATSTVTAWTLNPDPNQPPTASFSFECTDLDCSFNGSGSFDPDGSIVSYIWDFGDGQGVQGNSQTVSHSYDSAGSYVVVLTVQDDGGTNGYDNSVVSAGTNQAPTANFGFVCNGLDCSFNGSSSNDPDGTIVSYQWNFGDGSSGSGVTRSYTFGSSGTHQVTLTVTDDFGDSHSQIHSVQVVNEAPTANFSFACNELNCSFNGSSSNDPDGTIVSYQWNFGDGGSSSGVSRSHTYGSSGTYQVTLTVTDDQSESDSRTKSVQVTSVPLPSNQEPTADFSFSCDDLTCSFNGSSSNDPDGTIVSYQWNFGDGGSSSGVNRSHTYNSAGTFQVTLTVEDDLGATDSRTRSVQVTSIPPPPPGEITLSGSGSKVKGQKKATLSWSGATTSNVQILRDGSSIAVTSNDGSYVDGSVSKRAKSATYKVCNSGGSTCSNTITLRF
jgi:PKD repeat protein